MVKIRIETQYTKENKEDLALTPYIACHWPWESIKPHWFFGLSITWLWTSVAITLYKIQKRKQ